MLLVLHSCHVTPVAQPLFLRDVPSPPRLHLETVGHEAKAADRRPDVVRDVGRAGVERVDRQLRVQLLSVVAVLGALLVYTDVVGDVTQLRLPVVLARCDHESRCSCVGVPTDVQHEVERLHVNGV